MYYTIEKETSYEITEKKSKFIANLFYVENKEEAEAKIQEIKKKHITARHNCYAYRILENDTIYEKSSDDGEPSGTAGAPILNILQKDNLCNILIIVTRYFGGVLLGTGGLVRCYSESSRGTIENSKISKIESGTEIELKLQYSELQKLQYFCGKNNINITGIKYEEFVTCMVEMTNNVKVDFLNAIQKRELIIEDVKILKEKIIII